MQLKTITCVPYKQLNYNHLMSNTNHKTSKNLIR